MKSSYDCNEILELLNKFLDNELDPSQRSVVKFHLENCDNCSREMGSLREVDAIGKAEVFPDPGTSFWNDQRRFIANSIKTDSIVDVSRKSILIHWTNRVFGSTGLRTAVSLSAAAVILLFIAKDVFRNDNSSGFAIDTTPEFSKPETDIPDSEQKPTAQIEPDKESKKEIQVSKPSISQISEVPSAAIENKNIDENKTTIASDELRKEPDNEAQNDQESVSKTNPEFSSAAIGSKNNMGKIPVIVNPLGKSPVQGATAINLQSNLDMRNQSTLQIQNRETNQTSEIDFDAYLTTQSSINFLLEPLVRKDRWIEYLVNVKDKVIRDLIVYDVFEIYNSEVKPESKEDLKKEALNFAMENRKLIESMIGKDIFEQRLKYFKNLN